MNKLLISISILIFTLFIGCSAKLPKPYTHKIKETELAHYKKQILLNHAVDIVSKTVKTQEGCILVPNLSTKATCYVIKKSTIIRKDSINWQESKVFVKFINNVESKLYKEYEKQVHDYKKFKILFDKAVHLRKEKTERLSLSIVDKTNILDTKVLLNVQNWIKVTKPHRPYSLQAYSTLVINPKNVYLGDTVTENFNEFFQDPKDVSEYLPIEASIPYKYRRSNTKSRYDLKYEEVVYKYPYNKFPKESSFKIKNVYFDYIPYNYYAKNDHISIEVINNSNDGVDMYRNCQSFTILNTTNEFIEIESINLSYINGYKENILQKNKKIIIPPKDSRKIDMQRQFKSHAYDRVQVISKNQKINYGFSIKYKINNQDKTFYKTTQYSIADFK